MTKKHDIIWLESTDSTNEEVRRCISDIDNLSVVSASKQTQGRGQRGNSWSSNAGENLTFSIYIRYGQDGIPEVNAYDQFVISEIAALSVVDLLASHDIEGKIKWPNDIYVENRKICGILIENAIRENNLTTSIVGIGLNVNQTEFNPSLPNPTSMMLSSRHRDISSYHPDISSCHPERSEGSFPLHPLLEEYMDIFTRYIRRYLNITGGYLRLRKMYLSQMWRKDEEAEYRDLITGRNFAGCIKGVSDSGLLLVEDIKEGVIREYAFKEIGYIL